MVVPQLVHSIKRTFWWRAMTAVQKILLIMITYPRFWMWKADRKLRLISIEIEGQESSSSLPWKIFPLFYSIKDFLTLYEHLSRVGIDHIFTCLLQWKGLNTCLHFYIQHIKRWESHTSWQGRFIVQMHRTKVAGPQFASWGKQHSCNTSDCRSQNQNLI